MKTRRGVLVACAAAGIAGWVYAGDQECPTPPPPTDARFVAISKLAGNWEMDADKDGKADGSVTYKVTSGGHAVLETLFPGSEHEMITVYSMDKGKLRVTHYCTMGNAPSMVASSGDARRIEFVFDGGANVDASKDMYMGGLVLEFADADHFNAAWTNFAGGARGDTHAFEWTRVK